MDGAGSGLDADLLDGMHASSFVQQQGELSIPGQSFETNDQFESYLDSQYAQLGAYSLKFIRASINFDVAGIIGSGVWLIMIYKDDAEYGSALAMSYRLGSNNPRLAMASHIPSGWTNWFMFSNTLKS